LNLKDLSGVRPFDIVVAEQLARHVLHPALDIPGLATANPNVI
jgi:hypothetical protein